MLACTHVYKMCFNACGATEILKKAIGISKRGTVAIRFPLQIEYDVY